MNGKGTPTLAETMHALEAAVSSAPIEEIPSLLGLVEKIKAVGWGRMVARPQPEQQRATGKTPMTAKDVAPLLGVKQTMVYELVRQNKLRFYRVGKYIRFRESDIQDFLAQGGA